MAQLFCSEASPSTLRPDQLWSSHARASQSHNQCVCLNHTANAFVSESNNMKSKAKIEKLNKMVGEKTLIQTRCFYPKAMFFSSNQHLLPFVFGFYGKLNQNLLHHNCYRSILKWYVELISWLVEFL